MTKHSTEALHTVTLWLKNVWVGSMPGSRADGLPEAGELIFSDIAVGDRPPGMIAKDGGHLVPFMPGHVYLIMFCATWVSLLPY